MQPGCLLIAIDNGANYYIASAWLNETLERYLQEDDVVKPEFFAKLLIAGTAALELRVFQTRWGTGHVQSMHPPDTMRDAFDPHIFYNGSMLQVLRLYEDVQKAFKVTLRPTPDGK
jgi:hypothetical protein